MTSGGNTSRCSSGSSAPKNVGPSRIPASTSPITRGWPIFTASMPMNRAASITIATAMKKAASSRGNSRIFWAETFSLGGAPSGGCARVSVSVSSRLEAVPTSSASSPAAQVTAPRELPGVAVLDLALDALALELERVPVADQLDLAAEAGGARHELVLAFDGAGRRRLLGARVRRLAGELGLQRLVAERALHRAVADGRATAAAWRPRGR